SNAMEYYKEGQNEAKQIECCYMLQDYESLKNIIINVPDDHPILMELGRFFTILGMCREAVQAYLKCKMIDEAINACIFLNQWSLAIDIGNDHNKAEIDSLMMTHLKEKEKNFEIVLLYCKANHYLEGAKILFKVQTIF
ncbi:hypothetical protein HELRODRAFT_86462, partial [Helobdella robusta]|uniref:Coatomer WD associated region domain-containing protein n=1 Tax=Helobdella robusta TaxID=6412 RepID=T1G6C6_HELRO